LQRLALRMTGSTAKTRTKRPQSFEIVVPATSANLGPAFDAAALAFSMFLGVRAKAANEFSITARGRDREICAQIDNHLIVATYGGVLEAEGKPVQPLALRIENEIPIGKGCGSSAAARLAGIALAVHFGRLRWTDSRIVYEAALRENHPDNAAASWMGGLAIAQISAAGEIQMAHVRPQGKWPLLLAVPDESLSTEDARSVLPTEYSRADAVANIQNAMRLLAAFLQGRKDWLPSALEDQIHQPYRASLCPLLPALRKLTGTRGILGSALSGAGPSVLVFLDSNFSVNQARMRVRDHLRAHGLNPELILTEITARGARQRIR
jgi:homoserine kinase